MGWRRAIGAIIMLGGAVALAGAASATTIFAAGEIEAGAGVEAILARVMSYGPLLGWLVGGGLVGMLLGRAVYGRWRDAAPIAYVTGEITCTVGVLAAIAMGGLLIFLLLTGFKQEDTPAAIALGVGALASVFLAQFGVSLRDRRYLG